MGTRSLLGYELPNGRIYYQYLQFDGYPAGKGRDYYKAILEGLSTIRVLKEETPTPAVFKRIKDFLNEIQYSSEHSINNHHTCAKERWPKLNRWQEWQYLFTQSGDFIIDNRCGKTMTIPWEVTREVSKEYQLKEGAVDNASWWDKLDNHSELEENASVLNHPDPMLIVNDEFNYDSSKNLLEQRLKGVKDLKLNTPVFSLELGRVYAFPKTTQSADDGWRDYAVLTIGSGQDIKTIHSTFSNKKAKKKDTRTITVKGFYEFSQEHQSTDVLSKV